MTQPPDEHAGTMPKTVLVISANGGIGAAVTRAAILDGHRVIATVSRAGKMEAFRKEFPGCAHVLALDLSAAERMALELSAVLRQFDRVDGVVVCGAISPFVPLETTPLTLFREVLEVNCVAHLAIYQTVMPALRESRGRLIFTGSLSGRIGSPMQGAYVASKFALEGMVDVMRQEASRWGVEIVLLQPGNTDTPAIPRASKELTAAIEQLSGQERELYGELYVRMQQLVDTAIASAPTTAPDVVAAAALHALTASEPATRYRLGADAEYLIEATRTKSDRELDALILANFRPANAST